MCIFGYGFYCVDEFLKIDRLNTIPEEKCTKFELISIQIDGEECKMAKTKEGNIWIDVSDNIEEIEMEVSYTGVLINGFLECVINYDDNTESHVFDRNTYLMDFGFFDDYKHYIYGGEDTGLLQCENDTIILNFKHLFRKSKNQSNYLTSV